MRPRTPSFIWIPFVFSIATVSWALLGVSLALLAALLITPAWKQMADAERQRNNMAATVSMLDQQITLQNKFLADVQQPMVLVRLAQREFNVTMPGEQVLPLDSAAQHRDRSVDSMLHEALVPAEPVAVAPLPWGLELTTNAKTRAVLMSVALMGMAAAFLLGVRFERR